MSEKNGFYYAECRKHSGFTQEQASERLNVCVRILQKYESDGNAPDDIVDGMAQLYNTPLLVWWHLKTFSTLGKYLPDIMPVQTNGDMVFIIDLAKDDVIDVYSSMKRIYANGTIDDNEQGDYRQSVEKLKVVYGKIGSAVLHGDSVVKKFDE